MSRLTIAFAPGEGALVRVLGLVERRGFDVRAIDMADGSLILDVEPRDAARAVDMLDLQLRRLVDVHDIRVAA